MKKDEDDKEEHRKEFQENWETRELGCPPIKGNPSIPEQKEEKSKKIKQNQEKYQKNINDKQMTKDLYKNNFHATMYTVFNE